MNSLAPLERTQRPITTRHLIDRSPLPAILDAIDVATDEMTRCGRAGDGSGYRRWEAEWNRLQDLWEAHDRRQLAKRGRER